MLARANELDDPSPAGSPGDLACGPGVFIVVTLDPAAVRMSLLAQNYAVIKGFTPDLHISNQIVKRHQCFLCLAPWNCICRRLSSGKGPPSRKGTWIWMKGLACTPVLEGSRLMCL